MFLDATNRSIEIVLGGATTTNALPVAASWIDGTPTTITPGLTTAVTNGATAVTIVAAPAASTQRQVKCITVQNADTVAAIVTIRINDNTTIRKVLVVTLAIGDQLCWTDTNGWQVIDTNGNLKTGASGGGGSTAAISLTGTTLAPGVTTASISNLIAGLYVQNGSVEVQHHSVIYSASPCAITWDTGNIQSPIPFGFGGSTIAFTFTPPTSDGTFTLVVQVATGVTYTLPAGILWVGGAEPTHSTTNGVWDVYTFLYTGSLVFGLSSVLGDNPAPTVTATPGPNKAINSAFRYAQLQTPGTLTTRANDSYGADCFRSGCAGTIQYQRLSATSGRKTNLYTNNYGAYKCTGTGKAFVAQPMLSANSPGGCDGATAKKAVLSVKMMASAAKTWHLGLLYLSTSGTINVIPTNIVPTTWGTTGTDPTWGTNLALITPTAVSSPTGATISITGNSAACSVSSTQFDKFEIKLTLPTNFLNLIPIIYSDAAMASSEFLYTSEWDLYEGTTDRTYVEPNESDDLLQCQAYVFKSCDPDLAANRAPGATACSVYASSSGSGVSSAAVTLGAGLWKSPTVTFYDGAGTAANVSFYNGSSWVNAGTTSVATNTPNPHMVVIQAGYTNWQCEVLAVANL